MFAVPGWTVSLSALKTQTVDLPTTTVDHHPTSSDPASQVSERGDKKRKRSGSKSRSVEVNFATLSDLWEKVIEQKDTGTDLGTRKKRIRKKHKTSREVDNGISNLAIDNEAGSTGNSASDQMRGVKGGMRLQKAKTVPERDTSVAKTMAAQRMSPIQPVSQLTPLQSSMREKLISARFRHLNQTLYTNPSALSLQLFHENPEMFNEYHSGFQRQVNVWPENPLDGYLEQIRQRGMIRAVTRKVNIDSTTGEGEGHDQVIPLPRTNGVCYIADLGCGDAGLSRGLENFKKNLKLQVFSYDLQSPNVFVTNADIANLPLKDDSVDVAIFCLALMGTNWIDFIEEAFRILRWKGELWIAEIKSRFGRTSGKGIRVDHSVGNKKKPTKARRAHPESDADVAGLVEVIDEDGNNHKSTDVSAFVEVLRKRGFILQEHGGLDLSNKMFVKMSFLKGQTPLKGKCVSLPKAMNEAWKRKPRSQFLDDAETSLSGESTVLKPCLYKQR